MGHSWWIGPKMHLYKGHMSSLHKADHYSLVLGFNVDVEVGLKALGNDAMEWIIQDLWPFGL